MFTSSDQYRFVGRLRSTPLVASYEALHPVRDERVLVDLLEGLRGRSAALEAFEREIVAGAAARHPHVLQVLELGVGADGTPLLVSEHPGGPSLRSWLAAGQVARTEEAIALVRGLAGALAVTHGRGSWHGGFDLDDVFLTSGEGRLGVPKLRAFGPAWLRGEGAGAGAPRGRAGSTADIAALARVAGRLLTPPGLRGAGDERGFFLGAAVAHVLERARAASGEAAEGHASAPAFVDALVAALEADRAAAATEAAAEADAEATEASVVDREASAAAAIAAAPAALQADAAAALHPDASLSEADAGVAPFNGALALKVRATAPVQRAPSRFTPKEAARSNGALTSPGRRAAASSGAGSAFPAHASSRRVAFVGTSAAALLLAGLVSRVVSFAPARPGPAEVAPAGAGAGQVSGGSPPAVVDGRAEPVAQAGAAAPRLAPHAVGPAAPAHGEGAVAAAADVIAFHPAAIAAAAPAPSAPRPAGAAAARSALVWSPRLGRLVRLEEAEAPLAPPPLPTLESSTDSTL